MEDLHHLDRVPDTMRQPIESYAQNVRSLAGTNVLSLMLFGAIAAGTFDPRLHTACSVVVLQAIDLEFLRRLAKDGAKLGKARIHAPLIMTPEYIKASVDTFPLELIEIQQCRLCLFGPDYFTGLTFEDQHIRHQCERELKTILIGMRQALLASGGREKVLGEIERGVADQLMRTLRGLLWLHGQKTPTPASQVVGEIERAISKELPGIRGAIDERGRHAWQEFTRLYEEVDALRTVIDAW